MQRSTTRRLGTLLLAVFVIAAGAFIVLPQFVSAQTEGGTAALVGKAAPDFSLPTVKGETVKLADLKGKVVLLDFWATWCGPCRMSLPHVQELSANAEHAKQGLKVFAVNLGETKEQAKAFLDSNKYTFEVPLDANQSLSGPYRIEGIPTTVIVGRDGTVKNVFVGFGGDGAKRLDAAIEEALKAK